MSQQGNIVEKGSREALPRGMVLGYMGDWNEPTGVRAASRKLLVKVSVGQAIFALLALSAVVADAFRDGSPLYGALHFGPWSEVIEILTTAYLAPLIITFVTLGSSLVQYFLTPHVERGHRFSCWACIPSLFPPGLVLLLASAAACVGIIVALFDVGRVPFILIPVFLVVAIASTIGSLMLIDLAWFLWWIAKNPLEEKPPVPFLPTKGAWS